jgi:hypothetical protein
MRVLLDACVPRGLRDSLSGHQVRTAPEMGWGDLDNGDLLDAMVGHFDALRWRPLSRRSVGRTGPATRSALDQVAFHGYTNSMKTAVSIPDEVFQDAERLARRAKKSRSQLFSDALREYVARHAPDEVTDAMDRVVAEIGDTSDEFANAAARRVLDRTEW